MKNLYNIITENKDRYIYHGIWDLSFGDKIRTPIYFTNEYLVAKTFSCSREGGQELISVNDLKNLKPPVIIILNYDGEKLFEIIPESEVVNVYSDYIYTTNKLKDNTLTFDDPDMLDYIDIEYLSWLFDEELDIDKIESVTIAERHVETNKFNVDDYGVITAELKDNAKIRVVDVKRKIWDDDIQKLINKVEKSKIYDVLILKNITEGGFSKPIPINSDTYVIFNTDVLRIK